MTHGTVAMVMPRTGPTLLFAPYNYLTLATDLRDHGWLPMILDERIDDVGASLDAEFHAGRLAALCLTSMMGPQLSYAISLAQGWRVRYPGVPILWGGILPTELPDLCAQHDAVDIVLRGWGEGRLPEVVRRLRSGESLHDVAGLTWKEAGVLRRTADPPVREHPPLRYDWDMIDLNPFLMEGYGLGRRTLVLITSRGCPHHCTFCYGPQFHGSTWSAQSAEEVLADIDHLRARYDFDSVFFNDDNFAVSWKRTEAVARGMKDRGLTYGLSFHASYLDDERIGMLAAHGCVRLYWGPESGSPRMLQLLGKGATVEMNLEIARSAKKHGLGGLMGFMVGHPRETEADLQLTLDHIDELLDIHPGLDISDIKIFTPYPGTLFYDEAIAHGFVPPARLEDWATFYWNKANLPWLTDAQRRRLEAISYTSLCAFATWRTVGLNPLQNGVVLALQKLERERWRRRVFTPSPELRAIQAYVDLHRVDGSLSRTLWASVRGGLDRIGLR